MQTDSFSQASWTCAEVCFWCPNLAGNQHFRRGFVDSWQNPHLSWNWRGKQTLLCYTPKRSLSVGLFASFRKSRIASTFASVFERREELVKDERVETSVGATSRTQWTPIYLIEPWTEHAACRFLSPADRWTWTAEVTLHHNQKIRNNTAMTMATRFVLIDFLISMPTFLSNDTKPDLTGNV